LSEAPQHTPDAEEAQTGEALAGEASLASAFAAHHGYLRRYLARRIRSGDDADDVAQEVYLRALQFARRENKVRSWRGIFLRIAADLVVDGFRRSRARAAELHVPLESVQEPGDDELHSPERILQGRQRLSEAERTLEALDPECRRAFVLVRFHGYSYAETARELGLDTIRVGRLIERATLHLAKAMRP
jgi:RNA polymerase sigma factor (sigma-70 family)